MTILVGRLICATATRAQVKNKKVLIGVGVLVVVLAGGAYFMAPSLLGGGEAAAAAAAEAEAEDDKEPVPGSGVIFELSDRVVNLAEGGDQSFAKIKLALEFEVELEEAGGHGGDPAKDFKANVGKIIAVLEDRINAEISSRTSTDLATVEGKEELKLSILHHANELFEEQLAPVTFVYLIQFVMQ